MILPMIHVHGASVPKSGSRFSGDAYRSVTTPEGGVAVVVIDAQGSGPAAWALSQNVMQRMASSLNDGVSGGTTLDSAHQYLMGMRRGQVSAAIDVIVASPRERLIRVARMSPLTAWVRTPAGSITELTAGHAAGQPSAAPIAESTLALEPGTSVLCVTDGVIFAWRHHHPAAGIGSRLHGGAWTSSLPGELVDLPLASDRGIRRDDMTVVLLEVGAPPAGPSDEGARASQSFTLVTPK